MDNNEVEEIVSNKQTSPGNNDNDYDELVRNWLNLCMVGVSTANVAIAAWLQLSCACLALHASQPQCTPYDREATRRAFVDKENPKRRKFREKACHNWDKLYELYGDTRATGDEASGVKEKSKRFKRGLEFDDLCLESDGVNCVHFVANESSSYDDHEFSMDDGAHPITPEYISSLKSGGTSRSKRKRKASLVAVMEEGYKTIAASIHELSMALVRAGEKVAGAKFDVSQNSQILDALSELGLEEAYKVTCYMYLSSNLSKAAAVVAAPKEIRSKILAYIMVSAGT